MTSPSRRSDPQPMGQGWEIPLLVLVLIIGGAALAALAGLGGASLAFGGGWVWPTGHSFDHTLGGLLTNHPGRGLPPGLAARVPTPSVVYLCVAVAEVGWVALCVAAAVIGFRHYRPNDARSGMATRSEATQVLGIGQLHQARKLIRPDLYPTRRSTTS